MIKFSDTEKSRPLWDRLEKETSHQFVQAMRDFYSIYGAELVDWFAELYDPAIGGFYYSPTARDNSKVTFREKEYDLLPDAESTCQAMGFIGSCGISGGKPYAQFLPDWMCKQIADYIYGLQDPDGFFYHPQWGKDIPLSRRARDFSWSRGMLANFGRTMRYPTMLDSAENTEQKDAAHEVYVPEHLSSKSRFIDYMDSLNLKEASYSAGNTLSSQFAQIKSQGLGDVCIQYLNERQNPETGLWHKDQNYYGVNGLMKISGIYNSAGLVIPHSEQAALSAINAIASDEQVNAVVDLWNNWVAVVNICSSLRHFGGTEGENLANDILARLRREALDAIRKTAEKIAPFKKPGSSFSYARNYPCPTSQGMPVCISGAYEGDINGTVISSTLMVGMVYGALGLADLRVPLYGEDEAQSFLRIVEANNAKK